MVLEGASGPQTGAYDNDRPSSDLDPYDQSSSPSSAYTTIDFRSLPGPMPIFGSLFHGGRPQFQVSVVNAIQNRSKYIGRQFSQEETDALALVYAKALSYVSWGEGLGITAGLARSYQKADTFALPFGQRFKIDNPDKLLSLKGAAARAAWHGLRTAAYVTVGYFTLSSFFTIVAGSIVAVNMQRDPRLKDVTAEVEMKVKGSLGAAPPRTRAGRNTSETPQAFQQDDMSPQSSYDGALLSDNQMRIQENNQQQDRQMSRPSNERPVPQLPPLGRQPKPQYGDDYTPTQLKQNDAPAGVVDDMMASRATPSGTDSAKESAWDRLRREAVEKSNR